MRDTKNMYNIAIIGVGALGKRHLESVLKSELPCQVYVVDSSKEALDAVSVSSEREIFCGQDVSILPEEIEVAIIATSSAVRRKVFEQMISRSKVKNIIFEKVLFQRKEDYFEVEKQIQEKGIKAWVNCARREFESYINLKKIVDKSDCFTFHLAGGNWGLGCNGIHMLDLVQFLSDSINCRIDELNLLPIVEESKRKGYKEIFGTITGKCGKCQAFSIACFKDSTLPMYMELAGDNFRAVVMEGSRKLLLMQADNEWKVEEKEFSIPYQSQLTQKVIESIIQGGICNLPKYEEAMKLHLLYIEPLIRFFEEQGLEKGLCPIT